VVQSGLEVVQLAAPMTWVMGRMFCLDFPDSEFIFFVVYVFGDTICELRKVLKGMGDNELVGMRRVERQVDYVGDTYRVLNTISNLENIYRTNE